ncbi:MAG: ABC transporter ATP-binding protein [Gammaproteobacteria bacterium]
MNGAVLEICNAHRAFSDRAALQDVSLSVHAGEILALLGPNGAGKTTLMRAVAGRLKLDSGSVQVADGDPARQSLARRNLGIVPQTIALYSQLTARQNLDVLARLSGLRGKAIYEAVELALERALLTDRADDPLTLLSGGMQRRLNIVAGTLHNPKLLLLDEPTVGVDLHARDAIHALLTSLRDDGMAVLFSTHDFDQAAVIADKAAFMFEGRLLLEGNVSELITNIFGDAKEVVVELAAPAADNAASLLAGQGLRVSDDLHAWAGPLRGGYVQLADLEQSLEQAGVQVMQMNVREPGLGGVFRRLLQQEQVAI